MAFEITPATREQVRLRMLIDGPSGSGKTATGLRFLTAFKRRYGGKIGVIATEYSRDLVYVGTEFAPDGYDRIPLSGNFSVANYCAAINRFRVAGGYIALLIDSLSHAWSGPGGLLEESDQYAKNRNEMTKWGEAGKVQNKLIDAIISAPFHVIATARSRTEYAMGEKDDKGKSVVRRVGLRPVQRPGIEYEFGIHCSMDQYHTLSVVKTDCSAIDGLTTMCPEESWLDPVFEWLDTGTVVKPVEGLRRASAVTVKDFLDLTRQLGYSENQVRADFIEKYSTWIEDSSQEFLDEKLEAVKNALASKKQLPGGAPSIGPAVK